QRAKTASHRLSWMGEAEGATRRAFELSMRSLLRGQLWRPSLHSPVFFIVATLSLLARGGSAQRPPVFRGGTEQVVVPVTVKDARGQLVPGLQAADFRLLEDGVEQKLASFSADPAPLSVALLIDAALSQPTAQRLRATFPALAEAFSEFDEAGVF